MNLLNQPTKEEIIAALRGIEEQRRFIIMDKAHPEEMDNLEFSIYSDANQELDKTKEALLLMAGKLGYNINLFEL